MAQIVLDQVDKVYPGGVKGVDGLNLAIADGEFMVLVGRRMRQVHCAAVDRRP